MQGSIFNKRLRCDTGYFFEKLNKIFNDINLEFDKNKISILSMGMTSDYELAIKHGSNMIRIGSGLLGNY